MAIPLRRALLAALALALVGAGCGTEAAAPTLGEPVETVATEEQAAPPPTAPAYRSVVATSVIEGQQEIFENPGDAEPMTTLSSPTEIGAPLVFLVREDHGEWLDVYLPIRPNGSTGFVRRGDVELSGHDWHIEVLLSEFKLKVFNGDELYMDAAIAVAADNTPTPGGIYYTTELLQPPDPNGTYGNWAYGLSGFSEVHMSFNGGPGQLGIHGTNEPEGIGTKVSNGCIRMLNEDIDQLAPVLPLGVPVEIIT